MPDLAFISDLCVQPFISYPSIDSSLRPSSIHLFINHLIKETNHTADKMRVELRARKYGVLYIRLVNNEVRRLKVKPRQRRDSRRITNLIMNKIPYFFYLWLIHRAPMCLSQWLVDSLVSRGEEKCYQCARPCWVAELPYKICSGELLFFSLLPLLATHVQKRSIVEQETDLKPRVNNKNSTCDMVFTWRQSGHIGGPK